jgi:ketosteroid isomerase-like protein
MSQENVEAVRRGIEANHSGDLATRTEDLLGLWDPKCEYTSVTAGVDTETYRGHDGLRRYLEHLSETWKEWRAEVEEVRPVTENMVVATFRFHAVAKDSGVAIDTQLGATFVLSEGTFLRGRTYSTPAEALEAVGLSE